MISHGDGGAELLVLLSKRPGPTCSSKCTNLDVPIGSTVNIGDITEYVIVTFMKTSSTPQKLEMLDTNLVPNW